MRKQCVAILSNGKQCQQIATMARYCAKHFDAHNVELGLDIPEGFL